MPGLTLCKWVDEHGTSVVQIVDLMSQVCDAIQYCHDEGVRHGDLKPANIIVDGEKATLIDFGLAFRSGFSDSYSQSTSAHPDRGTFHYMSPEQLLSSELETRSEVYSLGASLYHTLAGELPFPQQPMHPLVNAICGSTAPRIRDSALMERAGATKTECKQIRAVVDKAMDKSREHRYQSARQLEDDLKAVASGDTVSACSEVRSRSLRTLWRSYGRRILTFIGIMVASFFLLQAHSTRIQNAQNEYHRRFQQQFPSSSRDPSLPHIAARNMQSLRALGHEGELREGLLRGGAMAASTRAWLSEHRDAIDRLVADLESHVVEFHLGDTSSVAIAPHPGVADDTFDAFDALVSDAHFWIESNDHHRAARSILAARNLVVDVSNGLPPAGRFAFDAKRAELMAMIATRLDGPGESHAPWINLALSEPPIPSPRKDIEKYAYAFSDFVEAGITTDGRGDRVFDHELLNKQTGGYFDRVDRDWRIREGVQMVITEGELDKIVDEFHFEIVDWIGFTANGADFATRAFTRKRERAWSRYPVIYCTSLLCERIPAYAFVRTLRRSNLTVARFLAGEELVDEPDYYVGGNLVLGQDADELAIYSPNVTPASEQAFAFARRFGVPYIDGRLRYFPPETD